MNKNLKYFCRICKTVKSSRIVIIFPEDSNGNRNKGVETEIFRTFKQEVKQTDGSTTKRETETRQLECGHFTPLHNIGLVDYNTNNLSEAETAQLRREIDRKMIGKQAKEVEQAILFQADQYNTLLKIASKQTQQAKYAIQYLDQLRERYAKTLSNEDEKVAFETKFAHFLDLKPTTQKAIERERTSVERAVDKQKAAVEAMKAMLKKSGFDPKELFGKKPEDNQPNGE